jgi:hypothetical protein
MDSSKCFLHATSSQTIFWTGNFLRLLGFLRRQEMSPLKYSKMRGTSKRYFEGEKIAKVGERSIRSAAFSSRWQWQAGSLRP